MDHVLPNIAYSDGIICLAPEVKGTSVSLAVERIRSKMVQADLNDLCDAAVS